MPSLIHRRDFLRIGAAALGAFAAPMAACRAAAPARAERCVLIMLTGGPSQLETWDPKPDAPSDVRGPFGSIATRIPGVRFSEHLPAMAALADRLTVIRSVHHHEAPIHEAGLQLLQTGQLARRDVEAPHLFARLHEAKRVPSLILPGPLASLGLPVDHGQSAGALGAEHEPRFAAVPAQGDDRYGYHPLGRACLHARKLVEESSPLVAINMFTALYDKATWDCHADGYCLNASLEDYRRSLCPMLDQAFTALVTDLEESGLLETTLVAALGEMGRTPRVNERGGRDHWTGAWSVVLAGGGLPAGRVVGATDAHAAEPKDEPVHAAEVHAMIARQLGGAEFAV